MTSFDKKRVYILELWCYRRLLVVYVERKTKKWVLEKILSVFDVEEEYCGEEDSVPWPHRLKDSMEKIFMQGKMLGKRRRADQQRPSSRI